MSSATIEKKDRVSSPLRDVLARHLDLRPRMGGANLDEEACRALAADLVESRLRAQQRLLIILVAMVALTVGLSAANLFVASKLLQGSAVVATAGWFLASREIRFRAEVVGRFNISLDLVENGSPETTEAALRAILAAE